MRTAARARILNINDNDVSRFTISRLLHHEGFDTTEAATGEEGLHHAEDDKPDLILCDIRLPDVNGYEVCRRLRENPVTAPIPVVHITAHATDTAHKVQSLENGADAYLTYPVDRTYLAATVRSLLRLRQAERERAELLAAAETERDKLRQSLVELQNEREIRERFVNALTHDLRNPLSALKLQLQMLAHRTPTPEITKATPRMLGQVERMNQMISDLLDVALVRAGNPLPIHKEPTELEEVARQAIEQLQTPDSRVRLEVTGDTRGIWDHRGLRRVFENLLQNAKKYGAADTPIQVRLTGAPEVVRAEVINQGNPIAREKMDTIFLPYYRGEQDRLPGWGIGLTLVKNMIEAHAGTIQVRSDAAHGTCFEITLPRIERKS